MKRVFWKKGLAIACSVDLLCSNVIDAEAAKNKGLTTLTFDAEYYYETYPDLQAAFPFDYEILYNHYLKYGLKEGRSGSQVFNCVVYKANYKDLQKAFGRDYMAYCIHYEQYGQFEEREALTAFKNVEVSSDVQSGEVLGVSETLYDASQSRATNIKVAADIINDVVLEAGEEFSYNNLVMPTTKERGFVEGPGILDGKFVMEMGGGVCQVSSTLNMAVRAAGITPTERHNHSRAVTYAVRGEDAAVSDGYKDYKFKNTLGYAIKIVASADHETGTLKVSVMKAE